MVAALTWKQVNFARLYFTECFVLVFHEKSNGLVTSTQILAALTWKQVNFALLSFTECFVFTEQKTPYTICNAHTTPQCIQHMVQSESSQLRPSPRPGSVTVPDHLIRCKLKLRFGELKKGKLNICSKFNLNNFPDKTIIANVTRNAF